MMLSIMDFIKNKNNTVLIKSSIIALLVISLVVLIVVAIKKERKLTNNERIKRISAISILSALSFVLYMVKFNLPFIFPSFLEIQFSNVPVLIGGFLYGPIAGVIIVIVRMVLKVPFTSTAGVGEFADLIIGVSIVLVSSLIYHNNKSKKSAIKALVSSSFTWIIVAVVSNWLFLIPFYIEFYFGGSTEALVGMLSVIPGVTAENYMWKYLLFGAVPFNLVLSTAANIVTFLVYKRVSFLAHSHDEEEVSQSSELRINHK
jgi:riboflavin transporter FmnP